MDRPGFLLGAAVIGALTRAFDNLVGRGEAAVTVPPLDGALRANRRLDEAALRLKLEGADCLAVAEGALYAAAGATLHRFEGGAFRADAEYDAPIACIAPTGEGALAVALETGRLLFRRGGAETASLDLPRGLSSVTALAFAGGAAFIANGSTAHPASAWRRDLMERNATGEVWRLDLATGGAARLASSLAWPAGLAVSGASLVVSEAWRHRLVSLDIASGGALKAVQADLPGYPGRLSAAPGGGWWLAVFAPRSQLVEFVLREPAYRKRMLAETPDAYWIAPSLRAGRSFYEPLQGGGVKQLGMLKPWAPTMSAGHCVSLDAGFHPVASLHSRADGATHGVTSVVEHEGRAFAAAKGDGVVAAVDLEGGR